MTPFNLQETLKGQPVVTKDNQPVAGIRQITYPGDLQYLTGMVGEVPVIWSMDGKAVSRPVDYDLVMAEKITFKYVMPEHLLTEPEEGAIKIRVWHS